MHRTIHLSSGILLRIHDPQGYAKEYGDQELANRVERYIESQDSITRTILEAMLKTNPSRLEDTIISSLIADDVLRSLKTDEREGEVLRNKKIRHLILKKKPHMLIYDPKEGVYK